jgi:hypothetical protein
VGIAVLISLLGFLLVIAGGFLFMPGAPVVPVLSAGEWPGLIVMFLGAGWSALGTFQFLRHGRGFVAKGSLSLLCMLALTATAANSWWALDLSYRIPPPADVAADKPIPAFELIDQNGNKVSDVSLRGKPVVLIFSRGVW